MRILITGITGTLGREVLSQLLEKTKHEVVGLSRDEQKQRLIPSHERLTLYLGDIRDRDRLVEATRGVDLLFHFAALKCVDTLEANPEEAIATNVVGTENVLHAQRVNNIWRVVLSSTDKAAYPINAYGFSKALAEKLVLRNKNNIVTRYGNVIASRGSAIPVFVKHIKQNKPIPLTHPEMTRFFLTAGDAASFVIRSSGDKAGGLKIPPLKAVKITEMGMAIGSLLGKRKVKFVDMGIRPGEKLHECLRMSHEDADGDALFSNDKRFRMSTPEIEKILKPYVSG